MQEEVVWCHCPQGRGGHYAFLDDLGNPAPELKMATQAWPTLHNWASPLQEWMAWQQPHAGRSTVQQQALPHAAAACAATCGCWLNTGPNFLHRVAKRIIHQERTRATRGNNERNDARTSQIIRGITWDSQLHKSCIGTFAFHANSRLHIQV